MFLLAISEVAGSIGKVGFFVCVALIIYAILPRRAPKSAPISFRPWCLLLGAVIEFFALSVWLALALPILVWLQVGERVLQLQEYLWVISAAIAALTAGIAAWRCWKGRATRVYARIHFFVPLLLLALLGGGWLYEVAERIEGTTAEAAANNILSRMSRRIDEPVHLVEDTRNQSTGTDPSRCKTYWIMGATEPRGRIKVCRYGKYWWTFASSINFPRSKVELERAKEQIKKENYSGAILILKSVIENYPNTAAETEAKELLQSLDEDEPRTHGTPASAANYKH